jgi:A/G-specific adenine glycosylase
MGKQETDVKPLATWFRKRKRALPWREDPSPYRVWVSEIMLQQTQVVAVLPYFERFMARFPSVEALAGASEAQVLKAWEGLGYYSRARNLHRGARLIAQQGWPKDRDAWLEIPGVGPYTAGAVASIALGQVAAIVDGNVERVLSRVYRLPREPKKVWEVSEKWVRTGHAQGIRPSVLNQALMELGALVCIPKSPRCEECPLEPQCEARAKGVERDFPRPKKRPEKIRVSEERVCVLSARDEVLLVCAQSGAWRAGLWDLPGVECAPRARAIGEVSTKHVVTRHEITRLTRVYRASVTQRTTTGSQWVPLEQVFGEGGEIAAGAALKRTLRTVFERFPEAAPKSSALEAVSSRLRPRAPAR